MKTLRWQIIIFVVLGFLAGISGGLLVFNFVLGRQLSPAASFNQIEKSTVDSRSATARLGRELNQVTVEFYKKKAVATSPLANVLLESDFLGYGSVITSDGWVLTHQNVFSSVSFLNTVLVHNGRIMERQKIVQDKSTGLLYIKTNIKNVPSIKLSNATPFSPGEMVIVGAARGNFKEARLIDGKKEFFNKEREVIHKSEDLYRLMVIEGSKATVSIGAPLMNNRGELIAVVARNQEDVAAVPTEFIAHTEEAVFKDQKIMRPYLGVTYIQLPKNFINDKLNFPKTGALIVTESRLGAYGIAVKSPALRAGIKSGDILISLNDEEINQARSLSELLLQYRAGDTVFITLLRAGQELTVKVELEGRLSSF